MLKKYTVMWVCEVLATDPKDAAIVAHKTIAKAPYSYFDVYEKEMPYQVKVPNDGSYMESVSHPYSSLTPKINH